MCVPKPKKRLFLYNKNGTVNWTEAINKYDNPFSIEEVANAVFLIIVFRVLTFIFIDFTFSENSYSG